MMTSCTRSRAPSLCSSRAMWVFAVPGVMRSRVGRWMERTTGAVLVALGLRVAVEAR